MEEVWIIWALIAMATSENAVSLSKAYLESICFSVPSDLRSSNLSWLISTYSTQSSSSAPSFIFKQWIHMKSDILFLTQLVTNKLKLTRNNGLLSLKVYWARLAFRRVVAPASWLWCPTSRPSNQVISRALRWYHPTRGIPAILPRVWGGQLGVKLSDALLNSITRMPEFSIER